jgi:hypothetical protein
MNLVYTFTKKLSKEANLEKLVKIYKESYKNNIRFHNIILYTDNESAYLFEDTFDKIVLKDFNNILLLDDYKYNVLNELNDDDFLFDGDIFLTQNLYIDHNFELLCEQNIKNILYIPFYTYYKDTIDLFLENKIENVIPFFKKINYVPNIGILKFKNKTTEREFLEYYWKMKNWFINSNLELSHNLIQNDDKVSAVFGQYLLGLFANKQKINISFLSEKNIYSHLSGIRKFDISLSKNII